MVDTVFPYIFLGSLMVTRVYANEIRYYSQSGYRSCFLNAAGISISAVDYELPDHWRSFCKVSDEFYRFENTTNIKLISIRCNVHSKHSGVWTMKDLKKNLKKTINKYKSYNTGFSVILQCYNMSKISLSFPFNVNNLFRLEVKGCVISDFFKGLMFNKKFEETQDSMRVLQLIDCVILRPKGHPFCVRPTFNLEDNTCIHSTTIESISFRNITDTFLEGDKDSLGSMITTYYRYRTRNLDELIGKCIYDCLKTFDRSQTTGLLSYFIDVFVVRNGYFGGLTTYNMSYNQLEILNGYHLQWSIDTRAHMHVESLENFYFILTFDLSHNNFATFNMFEKKLFLSYSKSTIILQYNKILTITVSDLEKLNKIDWTFIDLSNNHIDCNCSNSLTDLLAYIRDGNLYSTNYQYIGDLQCQGPAFVAGKPLKSLTSDMVCKPVLQTEYFLVPIYILVAIVIILIILCITMVKFRQEITIILLTRFNIVVPCQKRENNDAGKIYDAFVSYSSREDDFVENFFTDLENTTGFKFCMHHRDFVPGKTIFDNVTHSIESSRHTIILVSNHFIDSEFCLYEFQEAFRQSIMEKRRHLVIVILEEISEAKLPRDLRRCMNTFTYIRKEDVLFKERLTYALSVKRKDRKVKKKSKSKEGDNIELELLA